MKLDRNITPTREGKYHLILMRKVRALHGDQGIEAAAALFTLERLGVIRKGNENFGSQFFPLGYSDKFTPAALQAYAGAAMAEALHLQGSQDLGEREKGDELKEYALEIANEAANAKLTATKIPD